MVTASGIRIEPIALFGETYHRAPGITDMALGQFRLCRYGGHTKQWWSVLQHALVCREVAAEHPGKPFNLYDSAVLGLEALWHDAHEAVTGDVPSHWKPFALSCWQEEIDRSIHNHYNVAYPDDEIRHRVHDIDMAVLHAEAVAFGPPGILAFVTDLTVEQALLYPSAIRWVYEVGRLTEQDDPRYPESSVAIKRWVTEVHLLLGQQP